MSGTTSIDDLPLGPPNNDPVQLQVQEMSNQKVNAGDAMRRLEEERKQLDAQQQGQQQQPQSPPLSQEETSQLVSGLQRASQAGVLALPSRDIPMDSSQVNMDQAARTNYVPQPEQGANRDYIGSAQTADEIIMHSNKMKAREDTMDTLYDELQTPVLIAIMFFVFMIPAVRAFLFKSFPMLLQTDGNPTLGGYMYIAALFGVIYYVLNKLLYHFSQV